MLQVQEKAVFHKEEQMIFHIQLPFVARKEHGFHNVLIVEWFRLEQTKKLLLSVLPKNEPNHMVAVNAL